MQLGPWDVRIIRAGTFALDGGAMFGTVPKVVWNKVYHGAAETGNLGYPAHAMTH